MTLQDWLFQYEDVDVSSIDVFAEGKKEHFNGLLSRGNDRQLRIEVVAILSRLPLA